METLRTELIETQKIRSDLMKWKLLIVAGIGGAALGLSGNGGADTPGRAHYALAVIPIACVYVDLICRHLSLRNKAIGLFIGSRDHESNVLRDYERYYAVISKRAWAGVSLESVALVGCTVFLSLAIIPIGILASGLSLWPIPTGWPAMLFMGSGVCGVVLSLALHLRYSNAKKKAEALSMECLQTGGQPPGASGPPPAAA
jgi:hypothetical protein